MTDETAQQSLLDWDEALYLQQNPDVAAAVAQQFFSSGQAHYLQHGQFENRPYPKFSVDTAHDPNRPTRLCLDPWNYLEVDTAGHLKPCCIYHSVGNVNNDHDIERNNAPLRQLRQSLWSGQLAEKCQQCHIRPLVPAAQLQAAVRKTVAENGAGEDVLQPVPLTQLRIDINEACNLRCVYCAVSQPGYVGREMPEAMFQKILTLLPEDCSNLIIDLNGHGETTHHPHWVEYAQAVLARGANVRMLSNFAKRLSPEEISVMAQMDTIQVSLDTIDAQLLKQIRRKVSLETLLCNIQLIKVEAAQRNLNPVWSISCGVYDQNAKGLEDLARFAISAGFQSVTFWNLVEYPFAADAKEGICVKSISNLPEPEREIAYNHARRAVDLLRQHQFYVLVAGNFLD